MCLMRHSANSVVHGGGGVEVSGGRVDERRETRGCHNRSDYPQQDPALRVNMIWSADGTVTREQIPPVPEEIRALMGGEVSQEGKLVE